MSKSTERHWRKWGEQNPFFGVLSHPKFLNANLNEQSREEFFQSGERHVQHIYSTIQTKLRGGDFLADRVLDFGCGVGRLVIPFASRASTVVGLDISPCMLEQAAKNCEDRGLQGVRLLPASQLQMLVPNSFDLVHSYIVFQHIPVAEGEQLLQRLIGLTAVGGIGVIHLTFSDVRGLLRRVVFGVRVRSNLMHRLFNLVQGKPVSWPLMQMNRYSMNRVFNLLIDCHCGNLHIEFEDHGGFRGAILYFEKLGV